MNQGLLTSRALSVNARLARKLEKNTHSRGQQGAREAS